MGQRGLVALISYYYSRLPVTSAFGRFSVTLPTCPDKFFAPR
jgi:hypothetical protein